MPIDRLEERLPSRDEARDRDDVLEQRLSLGCDAVTLEALYDMHGASCYGLAHRMMTDAQLASAIVREVYLAVWTRETIFDPARGSVHAWLLGDTHRRAVHTLRGQRRLYDVSVATTEKFAVQPKLTAQRSVLELAYFGGYTQPEIATITGASLDTVKTLNREALDQLRTRRDVEGDADRTRGAQRTLGTVSEAK